MKALGQIQYLIVCSVAFFFFSNSVLARVLYGEKNSLIRTDGSTLNFYFNKPSKKGKHSILLYLQGSSCASVQKDHDTERILKKYRKVATIIAEKYGVTGSKDECPVSYLENNTIPQRIADYRQIFDYLRVADKSWDKNLMILGVSEGAIIGPQVSEVIPETKALTLVAGGGTFSMAENLNFLKLRQLKADGASAAEVEEETRELNEQLNEMRTNPEADLSWGTDTDTYLYWSTILDYRSSDFFKRTDIPLFIVHGTRDDELAIEGTRNLIERFNLSSRKNVFYFEYVGLNHFLDDTDGKNFYEEILTNMIQDMIVATGGKK